MPDFLPKWSALKAMRIGFLTGRGWQPKEIVALLGDGTKSETIRKMWYRAKLDRLGKTPNAVDVRITLTNHQRMMLGRRACALGMTSEEWLYRIVSTAIRDDLYAAIVDEETA